MRNQSVKFIVVCLGIVLFSCGTDKGSKADKTDKVNEPTTEVKVHTGGCVLCESIGEIPEDLYQVTEVVESDEFPPFTKKITSMGITLIGREEISDQFMINVALTIKEMFNPEGEEIDRELQEEMIRNMYKYKATIPLFLGHEFEMTEEERSAMEETRMKASICDIIMEAVPT